jgi:ZIP family zinc transporter
LVAGAALVLGALVAWFVRVPPKVVFSIMAVRAGVLVSALVLELVDELERQGGLLPTVAGFLGGAGSTSQRTPFSPVRHGAEWRLACGHPANET